MAATIATLLDMGWKPILPHAWKTSAGEWAKVGATAFSKPAILATALADIENAQWLAASTHAHGKGLEKGAYLHSAARARVSLTKEGNFLAAKALDYLVTGALKDPFIDPIKGPKNEDYCHRCNQRTLANRWHSLWDCPANLSIKDAFIGSSNWLIAKAKEGWSAAPCLWARGITPEHWFTRPEVSILSAKSWESANFKAVLDKSGKGYSDGSGGPKDIPTSVKMVSFGAVSVSFEANDTAFAINEVGCIGGQVPGRQTVPRAELWGGIQVLARASSSTNISLGIDASYVVNGSAARSDRCKGSNGDLWTILHRLIDDRSGATDIFKVKSHLEALGPGVLTNGITNITDLAGNSFADCIADLAGELVQAPTEDQEAAAANEDLGYTVAKRLAIVQADIWASRTGEEIFEMPDALDLQVPEAGEHVRLVINKLAQNGHRLTRSSLGLSCENCHRHRAVSNKSYWMQIKCCPPLTARETVKRHKGQHHHDDLDTIAAAASAHADSQPPSTQPSVQNEAADTREPQLAVHSALPAQPQPLRRLLHNLDDEEFDPFYDIPELYTFDEQPPQLDIEAAYAFHEELVSLDDATNRPTTEAPPSSSELAAPREQAGRSRKRLRTKTPSRLTVYGPLLVTQLVATTRKRKAAELVSAHRKSLRLADATAWRQAVANIEVVTALVDERGHGDDPQPPTSGATFDPSHHLSVVAGREAVYCSNCGAWSAGRSRKLAAPCGGVVPRACQHHYRLLQLGIIPVPGAVVPSHLRRKSKRHG
jgi:hypothetical protein